MMTSSSPPPPSLPAGGGGFFRGYTKLCKGLAVILLLVHLLVQLFPSAVTYLALIPSRYIDIKIVTDQNYQADQNYRFKEFFITSKSAPE